jgi:hypothetical protein
METRFFHGTGVGEKNAWTVLFFCARNGCPGALKNVFLVFSVEINPAISMRKKFGFQTVIKGPAGRSKGPAL